MNRHVRNALLGAGMGASVAAIGWGMTELFGFIGYLLTAFAAIGAIAGAVYPEEGKER